MAEEYPLLVDTVSIEYFLDEYGMPVVRVNLPRFERIPADVQLKMLDSARDELLCRTRVHRVFVSGTAFRTALDPLATGAHDEGLVAIGSQRAGRGRRYLYELDDEHLEAMISRLNAVGVSHLDSDDPETRAAGRACLKDRDRLARIKS